jgi:hypothetical protein
MKKIKIITSWTDDSKSYFKKQLKNGKYWDNFILTNDEKADFYVIINQPLPAKPNEYYDEKKTIYLTMEPSFSKLCKNFKEVVKKNKNIYYHKINGLEWWISKTYDELLIYKIKKNKILSSIISDNYKSEYHKKRVNFLPYLDKLDYIDLYGKLRNKESDAYKIIKSLKNYKGSLNIKDNGLLPYKYTFACENACEKNYFSEKIIDCILSECLCFYCGCPNLPQFINPAAYIIIDLNDPEFAVKTINDSIKQNEWEKRLNIIKEEKLKILNKLQLIPTIINIINTKLS